MALRHLDTNGDGLVSEEELWQALGDLGLGSTARSAAQEMVGEFGSQSSGVTVHDFLHFFRRVGCIVYIYITVYIQDSS